MKLKQKYTQPCYSCLLLHLGNRLTIIILIKVPWKLCFIILKYLLVIFFTKHMLLNIKIEKDIIVQSCCKRTLANSHLVEIIWTRDSIFNHKMATDLCTRTHTFAKIMAQRQQNCLTNIEALFGQIKYFAKRHSLKTHTLFNDAVNVYFYLLLIFKIW